LPPTISLPKLKFSEEDETAAGMAAYFKAALSKMSSNLSPEQ
jgi:hypothetical protein